MAASFMGSAETALAHDDHGTNVVLDIYRTNNNLVVLQFVTQANKRSSIQYVSSFVSTNVSGTNVVTGLWTDLYNFPVFPPGSRMSQSDPASNISRVYRLKNFLISASRPFSFPPACADTIDGVVMNAQETELYEFLKRSPQFFVSVVEISKNCGSRKLFLEDRNWARPVLRRMEMEGSVESNPFGEYRLKHRPEDTTTFKRALTMPGFPLGETSIITLDDVTEQLQNAPTSFIEKKPDDDRQP